MKEGIILQVGVKALLKNPDGKYLILHRNSNLYPEAKQLWDLPGGRINPGKPLLENLIREIYEETKLNLVKEPKLVAAQDIFRKRGYHVVRLTYLGEIEGEPKLNDEHDGYNFLGLRKLKELPEDQLDGYFKKLLDEGLFD